jgi:hypothetical protein
MPAEDFGWTTIAANAGTDWFIHGWGEGDVVTYGIVVIPGSGDGVPNPLGAATLTQGQFFQHVDGTYAQLVHIQNNAPFNSCSVRLIAQYDSLP